MLPPIAAENPKFLLVGSFGAGNVGDELILAGLLHELEKESPAAQICVLTADPAASARWHGGSRLAIQFLPKFPGGLRSFFRLDFWRRTLPALRGCDAVVFPGGGLFTDSESAAAIVQWSIPLFFARFFWRPVYLLGQSIGPIRGRFARLLAMQALPLATKIVTRDAASLAALRQLGVPESIAELGQDSALFLAEEKPRHLNLKKSRNLLVSVRPTDSLGRSQEKILAEALDELARAGWGISFVSFESGSDEAAWARIKKRAKLGPKFQTAALPESAAGAIERVADFDAVLAMRLHANIAAHLAGRPSLAISYSPKVAAWMAEMGTADRVLDLANLPGPAEIASRVMALLPEPKKGSRRID